MNGVMKLSQLPDLLKRTYIEWRQDRSPQLGAALAFYTIFSLTPLITLIVTVISLFYGEKAIEGEIVNQLRNIIGYDTANGIQEIILANSQQRGTSIFAGILSVVSLLLTSSAGFIQLKDSLDQIWHTSWGNITGLKDQAYDFARNNVLMFFMVILSGALILISIFITIILSALHNYIGVWVESNAVIFAFQVLNTLVSVGILAVLFAMIYKLLPDIVLSWKDVAIGAIFTSILFTIGKILLGVYLTRNAAATTYATAGALFVLIIWIYYSAQIFYFGAEFTKVYAYTFGSKRNLNPDLPEESRATVNTNMKKGFVILFITGILSFIGGFALKKVQDEQRDIE